MTTRTHRQKRAQAPQTATATANPGFCNTHVCAQSNGMTPDGSQHSATQTNVLADTSTQQTVTTGSLFMQHTCVCTITGNDPSHNRHVSARQTHNKTVTTGSLLLPHACVRLPQIHTSHKTASEPLMLASLVLQHTGRRLCAIIHTSISKERRPRIPIFSTHMCVQPHTHYH